MPAGWLHVAAYAIALVPAALDAWGTWTLSRRPDDPALAERLSAWQARTAMFAIGAGVFLGVIRASWWAFAVMLVAPIPAVYFRRRALFGETWPLWRYLTYYLRLTVAMAGFWAALAATPYLVRAAGEWAWPAAAALAALLIAWNHGFGAALCVLTGARPVADPARRSAFERLVAAFGLSDVTLVELPVDGGLHANAFALPAARAPRVLVTGTLVDRLTVGELNAIWAHELAHVEHFRGRTLRALAAWSYGLMAAAVLLPLAARQWPVLGGLVSWWPVLVVAAMVRVSLGRQRHEADCDRRAVEVTGDGPALVRALTMLHAVGRVPRRWAAGLEQQATHPSLARRVQAIQALASDVVTPPHEEVRVDCADGVEVVISPDCLAWRDGSTAFTTGYERLHELRIAAGADGANWLIVVDDAERRWTAAIAGADLARVQAALDRVDGRLGQLADGPPIVRVAATLATLLAALATATANAPFAAVVALLSSLRAEAALVAAAAAVTLATAALAGVGAVEASAGNLVGLVVSGGLCLAIAVANRGETPGRLTRPWLGGLVAVAALAWLGVALEGLDIGGLHRGVRHWTAPVPLAFAVAAATWLLPGRAARAGAVVAAILGAIGLAAAPTAGVERFGGDPFIVSAPAVTPDTFDGPLVATDVLPFEVIETWMSPTGVFLATRFEQRDERSRIHLWRPGTAGTDLNGHDLEMIDDSRALVLDADRDTSRVRLIALAEPGRPVWESAIPGDAGEVTWSPDQARWTALTLDGDDLVAVSGRLAGNHAPEVRRWPLPAAAQGHRLRPIAAGGRDLLATSSASLARDRLDVVPGLWSRLGAHLWRLPDEAHPPASSTALSCVPLPALTTALCAAYDGGRTRLVRVTTDGTPVIALSSVAGWLRLASPSAGRYQAAYWEGDPIAVDSTTGRLRRPVPTAGPSITELVVAEQHWVTTTNAEGEATVRLYRVTPAP